MKNYLILLNFTDQGLQHIDESPKRAADFKRAAESAGVEVAAQFWTAGAYDGALLLRAEGQETVVRLVDELAASGNVRTQMLCGVEAAELGALGAR